LGFEEANASKEVENVSTIKLWPSNPSLTGIKRPNSSFTNIILLQGCFVVGVELFSLINLIQKLEH
jgi:hypothetical protein